MSVTDMMRYVHNADENRYELYVGDALASLAEYHPSGNQLVFTHTETLGRYRGRGLAARLVRWALDDVRSRGCLVVARCWFVAEFIEEHPEYRDLVADPPRVRLT